MKHPEEPCLFYSSSEVTHLKFIMLRSQIEIEKPTDNDQKTKYI